VAQTRWVFCLCALASLATTLPGGVLTSTPVTLPAVLLASAALAVVWITRYVSGRALAVLDVTEGLAVAVLATTGPDPAAVFGFVSPPCGSARCTAPPPGWCCCART
jgi:hypothetical protein